jgi:hypothetical protein
MLLGNNHAAAIQLKEMEDVASHIVSARHRCVRLCRISLIPTKPTAVGNSLPSESYKGMLHLFRG